MKPLWQPFVVKLLFATAFLFGGASLVACRQTVEVSKRPAGGEGTPVTLVDRQISVQDGAQVLVFRGACDASGAVPLDSDRFLVADDEDNILRVYDATQGGQAVATVNLSATLPIEGKRHKEFDLEAATRLGQTAFFITSHGRNSKAKRDPNRLLFFALSLTEPAYDVVGRPYERLLHDMMAQPMFASLELARAAELAPKAPGGLNIEGLTATPDGALWVGLRNPIPNHLAVLFRIDNPTGIVSGEPPRFSSLTRLDLGGLGVRALSSHRGEYLVVAGPPGEGGPFRLYRWDGKLALVEVPHAIPSGLNPEGFFTPESRSTILMLSDDGSRAIGERPCKKLKDSSRKQFRAFPLHLP